jgi:hypothetical protein
VANRISRILEKLIAAIETVDEIIDQKVASNVRKHALRELSAALQQIVDCDNLWQALYESASGKPSAETTGTSTRYASAPRRGPLQAEGNPLVRFTGDNKPYIAEIR